MRKPKVDFLYVDCDTRVLLVGRNTQAKARLRREVDECFTHRNRPEKLGPAVVMNPQAALVTRYVLRQEGYTVVVSQEGEEVNPKLS